MRLRAAAKRPHDEAALLFLDVDGVLCCNDEQRLGDEQLAELQRVAVAADAGVVLSTDWRRDAALRARVEAALEALGVRCVGATPQRNAHRPLRPVEIREWLAERRELRDVPWVALDDRDLMNEIGGDLLRDRLVLVDPRVGLTARDGDEALSILRRQRATRRARPGMPLARLGGRRVAGLVHSAAARVRRACG